MFEDYTPPERFDCVIASFILEHVADPVALLKRIHGWTYRLIVVVGNAAYRLGGRPIGAYLVAGAQFNG